MKLNDLKKYDGKIVTITVHGKHITGKIQILEHTVKIGDTEIMPGQILSIKEISKQ